MTFAGAHDREAALSVELPSNFRAITGKNGALRTGRQLDRGRRGGQ